jgi:hypothetical protein
VTPTLASTLAIVCVAGASASRMVNRLVDRHWASRLDRQGELPNVTVLASGLAALASSLTVWLFSPQTGGALVGLTAVTVGVVEGPRAAIRGTRLAVVVAGGLLVSSILARATDGWGVELASACVVVFAAWMYLAAALRKVCSRPFMSGRVLFHTLSSAVLYSRTDHPDYSVYRAFSRVTSRCLSHSHLTRRVCAALALLAVVGELALAAGYLGAMGRQEVLVLAAVLHAGFLLVNFRRVLPFSLASVALGALLQWGPDTRPLVAILGTVSTEGWV